MQIRGVLFDWGGTLAMVDGQIEAYTRAAAEVLESFLGHADPDAVQSLITTAVDAENAASQDPEHREVDLGELLRKWLQGVGVEPHDGQMASALEIVGDNWVGTALTPVFGVRETLVTLRAMGMRIALVSNCNIPPVHCRKELQVQGIDDLLDCAVFSSGVGYRKPSRKIYAAARQLMAEAGGPEEYSQMLFVGDSPAYDVIMPAALGMHTALVASHTGMWSPEDYERAQPDFRIDSVTELPMLLADVS